MVPLRSQTHSNKQSFSLCRKLGIHSSGSIDLKRISFNQRFVQLEACQTTILRSAIPKSASGATKCGLCRRNDAAKLISNSERDTVYSMIRSSDAAARSAVVVIQMQDHLWSHMKKTMRMHVDQPRHLRRRFNLAALAPLQ